MVLLLLSVGLSAAGFAITEVDEIPRVAAGLSYCRSVVGYLSPAEGPPGSSSAWFSLHHLCRMLLLLTAGLVC
jgi:hypothetical protein